MKTEQIIRRATKAIRVAKSAGVNDPKQMGLLVGIEIAKAIKKNGPERKPASA